MNYPDHAFKSMHQQRQAADFQQAHMWSLARQARTDQPGPFKAFLASIGRGIEQLGQRQHIPSDPSAQTDISSPNPVSS